MGLLNVLRSGVKVADKLTKSLQTTVAYERATLDGYGTRTYAAAVSLAAIVDFRTQNVMTKNGELTACRCTVLFLDTALLLSVTNNLGVSDSDRITLPDGTTGPILGLSGFLDAGTGIPVATQVALG